VCDETGNPPPAPQPNRHVRRAIVAIKRNQAIRRMGRAKFRSCGWLNPAYDREDVELWARARRRRQEIDQILDNEGLRLPDGTPHPMLAESRHWSARETQLSDRLGFNPKSRADLRVNGKRAMDLVEAMDAEVVHTDGSK